MNVLLLVYFLTVTTNSACAFYFETQMPVSIGRQMYFVKKETQVSPVAFIRKVSNKIKYE